MRERDEIEAIADADYEAMLKRIKGNQSVVFLVGQVSSLIGEMMEKGLLNTDETVMFRDEMTILINQMLERFP